MLFYPSQFLILDLHVLQCTQAYINLFQELYLPPAKIIGLATVRNSYGECSDMISHYPIGHVHTITVLLPNLPGVWPHTSPLEEAEDKEAEDKKEEEEEEEEGGRERKREKYDVIGVGIKKGGEGG